MQMLVQAGGLDRQHPVKNSWHKPKAPEDVMVLFRNEWFSVIAASQPCMCPLPWSPLCSHAEDRERFPAGACTTLQTRGSNSNGRNYPHMLKVASTWHNCPWVTYRYLLAVDVESATQSTSWKRSILMPASRSFFCPLQASIPLLATSGTCWRRLLLPWPTVVLIPYACDFFTCR